MGLRFLIFISLSIFSLHSHGQNIIVLNNPSKDFVFSSDNYFLFEDKSGAITINDIVKPEFQEKFVLGKKTHQNQNLISAYWIKFIIKKSVRFDQNFILESPSPHTDDLRLFINGGKNEWIEKRSGQSQNFYLREFVNKNLIFSLPLDTLSSHTFYIRVSSQNLSSFDFRIKPFNSFSSYNTNEYFFLGIFYGILLIMALYNLMLFFSIRENIYIYYVLYVIAGMLSTLSEDCLGFQYVWYKFPQMTTPIGHHIAPILLLISSALYSRKFLDLKKSYPKFDKAILYSILVYCIYHFLHLTLFPEYLYFKWIYIIPFLLVYISVIRCFLDGYKPARFFVVGYTVIFLSIVVIQLRASEMIPGTIITVYGLNYGLVLEVAVLSFAMAERIKFIKKEKEEALNEKNVAQQNIIDQLKINEELKDKVNRELEDKVSQRTKDLNGKNRELEEANTKLLQMTEKANQMSLKLDLDNWNLQKNIKESIKARMSEKEVSYSEFNKIFPDEITCLRYLDELKWDENFKCRKCGNNKFINGLKVFSRKCTRCGYPESVTANTLFHGLRFPINKAFYMTYLIHRKNKITLDEISVLIDLRRNTCWNFKKKVLAGIENYQKGKKQHIETWEDIILLDD